MTNDPENPTVRLSVSTDVHVVLSTSPRRINFGSVKKGSSLTRYASLTGTDSNTVKIADIAVKNPNLRVTFNKKGFDGKKNQQIKIELLPKMNIGRFRERVTIKTDHESVKKLSLYVYGEVYGNIRAIPSYLSLGMIRKGQVLTKTIKVTATGDTAFTVKGAVASEAGIQVTTETIKPGKEYHVKVTVPADFPKAIAKGRITIKTDDKDQETILVRYFGRTKRPVRKTAPPKKQ